MSSRTRWSAEEDDESLVDRSVSFIKELASRLREQAGRKWRTTSLNLDIGLLERRRRHGILALGQAAYAQLRRGDVDSDSLREYVDEVQALERQIAAKESLIGELEEDDDLEAFDQEMLAEPIAARPRRARRAARPRPL